MGSLVQEELLRRVRGLYRENIEGTDFFLGNSSDVVAAVDAVWSKAVFAEKENSFWLDKDWVLGLLYPEISGFKKVGRYNGMGQEYFF